MAAQMNRTAHSPNGTSIICAPAPIPPSKMDSMAQDEAEAPSCEYDPNSNFSGEIKVSNDPPDAKMLKRVEGLEIVDVEGKSRTFGSLFEELKEGERVVVVFIRHFFCGNCQNYTRHLTLTLPSLLSTLSPSTKLILIGHGAPSLIPMYISSTSCPYPIFADPSPSKDLYKELAMGRTLDMGKRPGYQRTGTAWNVLSSLGQGLRELVRGGGAVKGTDFWWVGGEMVFEARKGGEVGEGKEMGKKVGMDRLEVIWCHRMRNTRDHVEVEELMGVLGIPAQDVRKGLERRGTGVSLSSLRREKGALAVVETVVDNRNGNGKVVGA